MTMHEFSYTIPSTEWQEVKTFTLPTPVWAGIICWDWASISCCPGFKAINVWETDAGALMQASQFGQPTGLHYQSFRNAATARIGTSTRNAIQGMALTVRSDTLVYRNCVGATVEMKMCMTVSDYTGSLTGCVCDESCGANFSYVGVTGVT